MSHRPPSPPPRLAARLFGRAVPSRWKLSVSGDLDEEWYQRQADGQSLWTLRPWYLFQSLRIALSFFRAGFAERDAVQSSRKGGWATSFRQDIRLAGRLFRRHPLPSSMAVSALALGIGVNSAVFSVVDQVLLRPLPYPAPERILQVSATLMMGNGMSFGGSLPQAHFEALRNRSRSVEAIAYYNAGQTIVSGRGEARVYPSAFVTQDFFRVLGVNPLLGRGFASDLGAVSQPQVMISEGLWKSLFGGDPGALGSRLTVDDVARVVVGIVPSGTGFPSSETALWCLRRLDPAGKTLEPAILRVRSQVPLDQADKEIEQILMASWEEEGAIVDQADVSSTSLYESIVGGVRPALWALMAAAGLVLLVACANVAHLMMARAAVRGREFGIRSTLGAGRWRLMRQVIAESLLLSCAGSLLGIGAAAALVHLMMARAPAEIPRLDGLGFDLRTILWPLALGLLTGVALGLVSSRRASRPAADAALRDGASCTTGPRRSWTLNSLLVGQSAMTLVLLLGASLLTHSFYRLIRVDLGYRPDGLLVTEFQPGESHFPTPRNHLDFYDALMERLSKDPGVRGVAAGSHTPMANKWYLASVQVPGSSQSEQAQLQMVSEDYFSVLGADLIEGRAFLPTDRAGSRPVAVLNQTLARRLFGDAPAVGQVIESSGGDRRQVLVAGVVADYLAGRLNQPAPPLLFRPLRQSIGDQDLPFWRLGMYLLVGSRDGRIEELVPRLSSAAAEIDPSLPPGGVSELSARLSRSVAQPRFYSALAGTFGLGALILVAVGLYGAVAYTVSRRTQEMVVRLALGASPRSVLRLVMWQGLSKVLLGVTLGLMAGLVGSRWLAAHLFGISARDPLSFAAVTVFLLIVTLAACWIPARRATRLDPMEALRTS